MKSVKTSLRGALGKHVQSHQAYSLGTWQRGLPGMLETGTCAFRSACEIPKKAGVQECCHFPE